MPGGADAFVSKISASGQPIWTRQWGTSSYDDASAISVDKVGAVFVAGYTEGNLQGTAAGGGDAYVTKINPAGSIAWSRQWGTAQFDAPVAIALDRDGNIYAGGQTDGSLGRMQGGLGDPFVTRLSPEGAVIWTNQFGTNATDYITALAVNNSGNVIASGITAGNVSATNAGQEDAFVRLIWSDGTGGWGHQWGTPLTDRPSGLRLDLAGNIFVVGSTSGALVGGMNRGSMDAFVTKLTSQGAEVWSYQFGSNAYDFASGVAFDKDENLLVVGGTFGVIGKLDFGAMDAFGIKISAKTKP